jgi:choline dehydrogenase
MSDSFHYIIIGAGSSGCVLANRLSEDANNRVLLVEAGGLNDNYLVNMPLGMKKLHFHPNHSWGLTSEPEPHLHDRVLPLPRGKGLGGSSAINAMVYARGHPADYDQWRQMGLSGWDYEDVLPYFKRSERNWRGETELHGGSGPMAVTQSATPGPLFDLISESAKACDIQTFDDYHAGPFEGIAPTEFNIGDGIRQSSAAAFIRPALSRTNLTIIHSALVKRIVIEEKRAVAVEYIKDGQVSTAGSDGEIILSAGTYHSPQILMLSGIGPAEHLQSMDISPVLDLPEVGENLEDHPDAVFQVALKKPMSFDSELRWDRVMRKVIRWRLKRDGDGATIPVSAIGFVRVLPESDRPDIEMLFSPVSPQANLWFPGIQPALGPRFACRVSAVHPRSRGCVRLRSNNPADPPRISMNFFDDPVDLQVLRDGLKVTRKIFRQTPLAEIIETEISPGDESSSDEELEAWLRLNAGSSLHPTSTCRMGIDDGAVVDGALRVSQINGLRIADCSVMPHVTGGNTHAPAVMIGEKAADLISAG